MIQTNPRDLNFLLRTLRSVTRRYRAQQLSRGIMMFVSTGCIISLTAGMLSHWLREGTGSALVLGGWISVLGISALVWLIGPLVSRHPRERIARLIETRLPNLKNTLTNTIQLAQRPEIRTNPFLPLIYQEARKTLEHIPVHRALGWNELIPVAWRTGLVLLATATAVVLLWHPLAHGWVQMFNPLVFVPTTSSIRLINVRPGDITLVKSQPLEIFIQAAGLAADRDSPARMVVEPRIDGKNVLELTPITPEQFAIRIERVDFPIRYRIELGETQSRWYQVSVLDRIELTQLSLSVRPPAYTGLPVSNQRIDPSSSLPMPIVVPAGSEVELNIRLDHPVRSAMLQSADEPPRDMQRSGDDASFTQTLRIEKDTPISILITDPSGQIIARLPDRPLMIRSRMDTAPRLSVRWPGQDLSISPTTPLLIRADLQDDLGLSFARIFMSTSTEGPMDLVTEIPLNGRKTYPLVHEISLKPELRQPGTIIRVRIEASDNRDLSPTLSTQTTVSPVYNISFRDPQQAQQLSQTRIDQIRSVLRQMLLKQQDLQSKTQSDRLLPGIYAGQSELRDQMIDVSQNQPFAPWEANIPKTLLMLATYPAQSAMELALSLPNEPSAQAKERMFQNLQIQQKCIISTLESLVETLVKSESASDPASPATTQPSRQLISTLDAFIQQQINVLDQTLSLARKPIEEFTETDRRHLDNLILIQDQLTASLSKEISRQIEQVTQGLSSQTLLLSLLEIHCEIMLARDTLKSKELEVAIASQQIGLQLAREILSRQTSSADSPSRDLPLESRFLMTDLPAELDEWIQQIIQQQDQLLLNLRAFRSSTDSAGESIKEPLKRLSEQQTRLRSSLERLNTEYFLGRYDRYRLLQAIAIMHRIESDLESERLANALHKKSPLLNALYTSRMLIGGEIHLQYNTTPVLNGSLQDPMEENFRKDLPIAWQDILKTYYQKAVNP